MACLILLALLFSVCSCSPCGEYPCIPGADFLGAGYDAVLGQSTGIPILQFTFQQKNFWVDPFQYNQSITYSLADQVMAVNIFGMKTYTWSFEDTFSYSKFLASQQGLDVSTIVDSSGWFASQVYEIQDQVESQDQTYAITEQSISLYELTVLPSLCLLSKSFQADVMSLPTEYDASTYLKFIQSHGTHVVVSAKLGGKSNYKSFADSSYTRANSNFVLGGNARADFYDVKGGFGGDYSHRVATEDFKKRCASTYIREGGDPTIDENQWQKWVETIGESPVVLGSQLKLISDYVNDTTRRNFIKQTIEQYSTNITFTRSPRSRNVPLSGCNCYSTSPSIPCSEGYIMQGTSLDGTIPPRCCVPCYSWRSSSFSSKNLETKTPEDTSNTFIKLAEKRNKIRPSKCGEYECIPGLDSFGNMFDAVKGKSKFIPAISFTFVQGKTWQNPWNPKLTYAVPDQIELITSPEKIKYSQLINSTARYMSYLSKRAGIDMDFIGFGLSNEVSSSSGTFQMSQNVLSILSDEYSFYKLVLTPRWNVSQEMHKALENLITDNNRDKYSTFFQAYGTHYVASATYGGKTFMLTSVNRDYYAFHTDNEVKAMVELMYNGFSLGFGKNNTDHTGFDKFYASSFSEFYLEGGNYLKYSASQIEEWKKSILYAPSQIQYTLRPIHELISDPKVRKEFTIAVKKYSHDSMPSETSESTLVPTYYQGTGYYYSVCEDGWAHYFEAVQDNVHFFLPLNCSAFYWAMGSLPNPAQCNCQTSNNPMCPEDAFLSGTGASQTPWGYTPEFPFTCCGVCVDTNIA